MNSPIKQTQHKILVVDDEEAARFSLAEILRLEGYCVETTGDGDSAIKMIQQKSSSQNPFDLILLDLRMPGIDGIEVLRTISKDAPDSDEVIGPIVIILTAHGSLESAIEALRHGAQDYLLKPASPDQIIKSITRVLQVRSNVIQKQRLTTEQSSPGSRDNVDTETYLFMLDTGVLFDLSRREISFVAENQKQVIKLTQAEGKLMRVFLEHPRHVFTHRMLVGLVQGYDIRDWEAAEVLRPLISRLRHKLSRIPGGRNWVVSVRGTGYVFDMTVL